MHPAMTSPSAPAVLSRVLAFGWIFAWAACLPAGCAHLSDGPHLTLATVDVVDEKGTIHTPAQWSGKVVVIDLCAAWSDPCLLNARTVSDACAALCGDNLAMVTILLDELGEQARESYVEVLGVRQEVYLPGPTVRAGKSALGDVAGIPRLLIFDRDGRLLERHDGRVLQNPALIDRVREYL